MGEILCFGDSNTWGYNPATGGRYPREVRWPGVLQRELGNAHHVIEEGLCGRTTVWDDPIEGDKNGSRHLEPCLESHKPLDLVIIMLGTNDLKHRFSATAFDIAQGAGRLVIMVRALPVGPNGGPPEVLLVAPPPVARLTAFASMFQGAEQKSRQLSAEFGRVAAESDCQLFDASAVIVSSDLDGIHFDRQAHEALGVALARRVRAILG